MDGDPFFEEMYRAAGDDLDAVPWAKLEPLPDFVEWLEGEEPGAGRKALVIGCGYGDDAEELARRGWKVSAFDLSPTAIERTRERFPESSVDYRAADLFDLPAEWRGRFDLVVEIRTLQAIPIEARGRRGERDRRDGRAGRPPLASTSSAATRTSPAGAGPGRWCPRRSPGSSAPASRWESRREVPLADGEYPSDRVYEIIGTLHRPRC